ncbi:MAG: N-formylglutamate amidohydrolase [Albidovulum sp.]
MARSQVEGFADALLQKGVDPEPVQVTHPDAAAPLLLICEHAGRAIPEKLGTLGLSATAFDLHIAYDIGAKTVATSLAERFGCTLVAQRYSRLVIDCNRPAGSPQSIPQVSDEVMIPGNTNLSAAERALREKAIFAPFAERCEMETQRANHRFAFAIHSFTPRMGGKSRPWDIGFLYRAPCSRGDRLVALCRDLWPGLTIGENQPYQIEDATDWFIPACAEPRKIPHCLIEVRNDHLLTAEGCALWVERLYQLLSIFMEQTDATHA